MTMSVEKTDLNAKGVAQALSKQLSEDIDEFCIKEFNDGHRSHLGASLIGGECKRKLWYIFRWCKAEQFEGRILRLFNRGHLEEDRFIKYLEGIGAEVWADDLQNNKLFYCVETESYRILSNEELKTIDDTTSKLEVDVSKDRTHINRAKADGVKFPQFRVSGCSGHFGGSLDSVVKLPPRFAIEMPLLGEFKTSGDRYFKELLKSGVAVAKPEHFAQMSIYGQAYGLTHAIYMAVNKNTDELYIEVVKLNFNLAQQMVLKAEQIITAEKAPSKMSMDETHYKCKFCNFKLICHKGDVPEKNCRSCTHAKAIEGGQWYCKETDATIPKHYIETNYISKECKSYKAVTQNV